MNYFAQGVETGARIGASAYEQKKRQKQEDELARLSRELQLDLAARRETGEDSRLKKRLEADLARQWSDQAWRSGEGDKDRTFRSGERQATQTFQSGESQLDRDARAAAQGQALAWDKEKFAVEAPVKGLLAGVQARQQAWAEDPANPLNKYRSHFAEDGGISPVGFNGGAPSPVTATSPQDQQALQWARSNPNDPRAKVILQRLGVQ